MNRMDRWESIREAWMENKRNSAIANVYAYLEAREKPGEWYDSSPWHLSQWAEQTIAHVNYFAEQFNA
jgi:hypothetical protein